MNPPVIGLTLNYRDSVRTSRCVQSLLQEGAVAVLIWDNSGDGGASSAELRHCWACDERVIILGGACNLGFSAGVNEGLAAILLRWPGAWVMLLNNDAVLLAGAIAELHAALLAQQHAVLAYPVISHGGCEMGKVYYQPQWGLIRPGRMPGGVAYPSGCALLVATERAPIPWLDEDFFMYGEDILLGWRLGENRMAHVPKVLVDHEGSASSGMGSPFYESRMVAAHWLLARKMGGGRLDLAAKVLGRMLSLGLRALIRSLRYRSLMPWWALWAGWRLSRGDDPALLTACQARAGRCPVGEAGAEATATHLRP